MAHLNTYTDIRLKETVKLIKSGGTYTVTPANPSGNRTLNIIDPGGNDDFLFAAATQTISGKTLGSDLAAGGFKITGLGAPSSANDAATKTYVDSAIQGLDLHEACKYGTTTALAANTYSSGAKTLTGNANGAISVDSATPAVNDRILVKDESTASHNGIYVVTTVGSGGAPYVLTRATDMDSSAECEAGMFVFVSDGTSNGGTGWVLTSDDPITLDTDNITWTQFSSSGTIVAGDGLTKTGNTIDVVGTSGRISVAANSIDIDSSYVGQNTITTLGTITTGTWSATTIAVNKGGTGSTTAAGARGNLSAAPNDATYYTSSTNSELTNEVVLTGGTGIDLTAGSIDIDSTVVTLSGTQTLTNKTLTTPIIYRNVVSKTSNYSVVDADDTIEVNTSSGNVVLTFPQAQSGNKGKNYRVRKISTDSNKVTVQATSCNVIGAAGGTTVDIEYPYDSVDFESNGSNYYAA